MSQRHLAVVGGGLAGCAAALAAADAGVRVTLLEARRRLGGATFSFQRDGLWFDNGQHVHLRCCTAYRAFIDRIGAAHMLTMQDRLAIPVMRPGQKPVQWIRRTNLPAPFHLIRSLATYGHLSPGERLRVGRAVLGLMRLDLCDGSLDQRTFLDWLRHHGQSDNAVESLWDLIILPTLNLPSSRASLWLAAMVFKVGLLHDRTAGDVGYTTTTLGRAHGDQGLKALRNAGVEVRLGEGVAGVSTGQGDDGAVVHSRSGPVHADAVILAVPHAQAASMVPRTANLNGAQLSELGSVPIVNLHVIYDRTVMEHPFVAGVGTPLQWVFDRTQSAGMSDGQVLAISLSSAAPYINISTGDLRERFAREVVRVFPRAREARLLGFYATREHQATFCQGPGSLALRPQTPTHMPNLFLAGAWTHTGWPATMEGAVRSGNKAAREAVHSMGAGFCTD